MDNTDRIRELIREIQVAEERLAGVRARLARLIADELAESSIRLSPSICRIDLGQPIIGNLDSFI